jgi:hypothetical protein
LSSREEVLLKLLSVRPGEHNIVIYEDLHDFGDIYSEYCKQLLENKNYVVFLLIFSEDNHTVIENLERVGIDTNTRLNDGSLLIEEAAFDFFCSKNAMLHYFARLKGYSKNIGKDGLVILLDINCLYLFGDNEATELLQFETNIIEGSHLFLSSSSLLCCYPLAVIGKLKDNRNKINSTHHKIIHTMVNKLA